MATSDSLQAVIAAALRSKPDRYLVSAATDIALRAGYPPYPTVVRFAGFTAATDREGPRARVEVTVVLGQGDETDVADGTTAQAVLSGLTDDLIAVPGCYPLLVPSVVDWGHNLRALVPAYLKAGKEASSAGGAIDVLYAAVLTTVLGDPGW